jgi:hypothetical protein
MGKTRPSAGGHDDQIGISFIGGFSYFLSRQSDFYKGLRLNR